MDFEIAQQFLLFLVSLVANTLSAFSGGGAGLVQFPALIFLGLPFVLALATHKVATVALGVGATLRHLRASRFERQRVLAILGAGLPGVLLGAVGIVQVPGRAAEIALGVLTISLGLYSISRRELGQEQTLTVLSASRRLVGLAGVFLIGVLNGSLTSGTGLFLTLWLVRWYGLDYKQAVAYTLVLVGLVWNGTGALTLGMLTEIQWDWMPALLAGSLLGGYLGAHLSIVKGNRWIKRVFETVTLLVGVKLLIG